MPTVTMPQLGESVAEGTIGKWLKQVGDAVELGEPIVEVVTDKVNAEVPSPFAGTLTQILVAEGQTVPNDADIAVIEASGTAVGAAPAPAAPAAVVAPIQAPSPAARGARPDSCGRARRRSGRCTAAAQAAAPGPRLSPNIRGG